MTDMTPPLGEALRAHLKARRIERASASELARELCVDRAQVHAKLVWLAGLGVVDRSVDYDGDVLLERWRIVR